MTKSCTLDRIDVRADDENGVSDAGLLVAATLGHRLGLGELLGKLNSYNRSTKEGKQSAVNLCLYTQGHRITINEGRVSEKK